LTSDAWDISIQYIFMNGYSNTNVRECEAVLKSNFVAYVTATIYKQSVMKCKDNFSEMQNIF